MRIAIAILALLLGSLASAAAPEWSLEVDFERGPDRKGRPRSPGKARQDPEHEPAPYSEYRGKKAEAFGNLDGEIARAIFSYHRAGFTDSTTAPEKRDKP